MSQRDAYGPTSAPLFTHPPRLGDVLQTSGRACSLAAAVIALTLQSPASITNLFEDHNDGTVTVRLHPTAQRVHKSVLKNQRGALWWKLLQKAFATNGWPHDGSHTQACPGGYCDTFMQMLTGKHAYAHEVDMLSPNYLHTMLAQAQASFPDPVYSPVERLLADAIAQKLAGGRSVCMSTRRRLPLRAWGISAEHSYAVLAIRHEGQNTAVRVYDPRGACARWLGLRAFLRVAIVLCFGD